MGRRGACEPTTGSGLTVHEPGTMATMGSPARVDDPTFPGCLVRARPVGVLWMEDEKGPDAKIICVPVDDPGAGTVKDLEDLPGHLLAEIQHFFDVYKTLEPGTSTSTRGHEGRRAALTEIAAARARSAAQARAHDDEQEGCNGQARADC
jgi:inorganic pyrophosphatase